MNVRKKFSLKNRLYLLLLICVIPLTVMITYLLFMINNVSSKYDHIVEKITKANAYNIGFKEDIDYVMYIIVVNSERAEELVDTQKPQKMIKEVSRYTKAAKDDQRGERGVWGIGRGCRFRICETASLANFKES